MSYYLSTLWNKCWNHFSHFTHLSSEQWVLEGCQNGYKNVAMSGFCRFFWPILWECWMILNKQELQCLFGICGKEEMARCGTTHPSRANLWCINMIFSTKYGSEHKKIIITNAPHQFINTTTNKSHPGSYKCNIHAAFCVDLNCTSISIYVFSRQLEHVCGSFNSML